MVSVLRLGRNAPLLGSNPTCFPGICLDMFQLVFLSEVQIDML